MKTRRNLTISSQALENWFEPLNSSNGIYFLDVSKESYNIHYKDQETGRLMNMDFYPVSRNLEESSKVFLDKLLLDLTLFNGTEPILVFNKKEVEKCLHKVSVLYWEYQEEINSVIKRLISMDGLFKEGYYFDSYFNEITPEAIYEVLFPRQSYNHAISSSYALYQMLLTVQSIHFQIANLNLAA